MDNKWSDSLRQKMEHHGETPPEGLWDAIERGMDRRAELASRRRRTMLWSVGSSAAAAVVALLLVINFGGTTGDPAGDVAVDSVAEHVVADPVVADPVVADTVAERAADPVVADPAPVPELRYPVVVPDMTGNYAPETVPGPIVYDDPVPTDENPVTTPGTTPEAAPEAAPQPTPQATPEAAPRPRSERPDYEQYMATDTPPVVKPRKSREQGKWQTGLYASNSSMSASRSRMDLGKLDGSSVAYADSYFGALTSDTSNSHIATSTSSPNSLPQILYSQLAESVRNNVKHRLPVTVGVSVGRGLGERWSIAGGVTYTRLASTFDTTSGLYSGSYEQVLHYIGIPLDVRFDLWRSAGGFSVYLSAGGQAAKSVGGRVTAVGVTPSGTGVSMRDGTVTDPRVRWSVRGSAGVGYDFIRGVGLYAEPGVDYHFDNGSGVVTVWKDRPLSFGLRLGLRVSL